MQHFKKTKIRCRLEFACSILSRPDPENLTDAIYGSPMKLTSISIMLSLNTFLDSWFRRKPILM